MQQTILIADIGGTNSRFQIWQRDLSPIDQYDKQAWLCVSDQRYLSQSFDSFDLLIDKVMQSSSFTAFQAVVIGAAGPVVDGQVTFTNLSWSISLSTLQARFPSAQVSLLNDFTVAAFGLDDLGLADSQYLYAVADLPQHELRLLVGAGTGLGVALLQNYGADLKVVATEAGHIDFAPLTERDFQLQCWLMQSWQHVSFERLVSGDGLVAIYQFLTQHPSFIPHNGPSAAVIAERATVGDELAIEAIKLFWGYYGQFIGNIILCWPAYGGVYITGGMAPKLVRWLKESTFFTHLWQKGRMQPLIKNCPIQLVTTGDLGLIGARGCAHYQLTKSV